MTIVGVVRDTKDGGLDATPVRAIYTPFQQGVFPTGSLVIRTDVDPNGLAKAAREVVRSVDPRQPIEKLMPLDAIRDESIGPRRINAMLIGSFSLLALVIAAIGIAAVLAFSVSARTNEIGIRMSLGADSGTVQRMVLGEGGVLLVAGLVLGVVGAVATTRLIQGLLYGVAPDDPGTITGVSAVMAFIGLVACWIPARRAARIDPAVTMRRK
jgi:putative ABC transport system permease protein